MSVTCATPRLLRQIEKLPPVAPVVEQLVAATLSPNTSASDVARVLSSDPTIAAKVLRIANSPFYGAGRRVTQISRAVVMLGAVAIRNLVTAICAREALTSAGHTTPEHTALWQHSIAVASACDLIARRVGFRPPEEAFLSGLLHDIGQLAMVTFELDGFRAVLKDDHPEMRFLDRERHYMGMDHVEAGYHILTQWHLPEVLCRVVRDHHTEQIPKDEGHARMLATVMLADILAHMVGMGLDVPAGRSIRAEIAAAHLGLSDSDQLQILDRLNTRVDEVLEMFSSTDSIHSAADQVSDRRAIWISAQAAPVAYNVGQLLLEHRGYEVQIVSEKALAGLLKPEDLVIIDLPDAGSAASDTLASLLVSRGFPRVAILRALTDDQPVRWQDSKTGVARVPRLFTAFDLRWMEGLWPR